MKLFTLYVGTEQGLNGEIPKSVSAGNIVLLKNRIADEFGGYSVDEVKGGYRMATGELVEEGSIRVEIVADEAKSDTVRDIARWTKQAFQQESVLLTSATVDYSFV